MLTRLLVAALIGLVPLTAHAETAFDRVMKTGVLRCGYWTLPPFSIKDPNTGAMSGFAPAMIGRMAEQLNLKVEWAEEVTFGTMFEGLSAGRYDAVCTGVYLAGARARVMEYTSPYIYSVILTAVRADDTRFDTDFNEINQSGVKVAVQTALGETFLRDLFPAAEGIVLPDTMSVAEILLGLKDGKYDVVPLEPAGLRDFNVKNDNALRIIHSDKPLRTYPWVLAVAKGEHDLASLLNAAQLEMDYNGEIARLAARHGLAVDDFYFNKPSLQRRTP